MLFDDYSKGRHDFPSKIKEYGFTWINLYEDVLELKEWVQRVCNFAKENATKRYTAKQIQGDAFEHLVQCVIELRKFDEAKVNCVDISTVALHEPGVDLIGTTHQGSPHAHQCKFFRHTSRQLNVTLDQIAVFPASCHKYGANVTMTLWTTAKRISSQAQKAFGDSVNVFGYEQICDFIDGEEYFWEDLYPKSLGAQPITRIGRLDTNHCNPIVPHDYQSMAVSNFVQQINKNPNLKGRYVYPTGAGKTLIEGMILQYQLKNTKLPSVFVVVAPRIALVNQLMRDMRDYIGDLYKHIGFHSGESEFEGEILDDGWIRRKQRNTVNIEEVILEQELARRQKKHLIIYSTYHSLWKLSESAIQFETMIADESQYCISRNYFIQVQSLKAKVKLFFTATERHNSVGENSNDNERVFGKIIGTQTIKDLINRKILTEPRLHLMYGTKKQQDLDSLVAEAEHISTEQRKLVHKSIPSKTLFACKTARNVETIIDHLDKLKQAVLGHTIFSIISNPRHKAKIDGKSVSRNDFLSCLENVKSNSIIFHYDILSEGIDIDGITGVAILRNMGQAKLLQTIGRCLRPYKANPEFKKFSHISVSIIDKQVQNSEEVRNIIRQMLIGGHEVNVEHVKISYINSPNKKEKNNRSNSMVSASDYQIMNLEGGRVEQTELTKIVHEIEVIRQETAKLVQDVESELEAEYLEDMYRDKISPELVNDMFLGVYQEKNLPQKKLKPELTSPNSRYRILKEAWATGRMRESIEQTFGEGKSMRPLTPHWIIEDHIKKIGKIDGKSVLTFNVEYVPFLQAKGAIVTVTTKDYCPLTKIVVESQIVSADFKFWNSIMKNISGKFDIVIGNPPYQERKPGHKKSRMIWQDFVIDAYRILKDNGILAMIHPPAWRGTGNTTPPK